VEYACKREPVFIQETAQGTWLAIESGSPFSVTALKIVPGEIPPLTSELIATPTLLENSFVRVELNEDGDITRVFDKANRREVIVPGHWSTNSRLSRTARKTGMPGI
jgi:alpha-mannosidase